MGLNSNFPSRKSAKQCFFGGECVEKFFVDAEKLYRALKSIVEVLREWV
jgi:hypothetical protein